jgi:hypothetical protein
MPAAALDTDEKYTKLVQTYNELIEAKRLAAANDDCANNNPLANEKRTAHECKIFDNVSGSIEWLLSTPEPTGVDTHTNIVITGSLYLVGLSLKVLNFKID